MIDQMKGLYVHIPFCAHICHYCDFVKRVPKDDDMIDHYLDRLLEEIQLYHAHMSSIQTIYIGGGTPSMLSVGQLEKLFEGLKDISPIEYTIEVNPESYHPDKGILFKKYGVNRVSLGVQTFNQTILKTLNRKHTNDDVYNAINHLKSIGISNISVDLIYGLPKQTMDDLDFDLKEINRLDIPHVSCYSLILEEKTVFYHQYLKGNFKPISEDLEAMMYQKVMEDLKQFGYQHYEISNFAKHNLVSNHNLIYWNNTDYIGVGLGAHGYLEGFRTHNHRHLPAYEKAFTEHRFLVSTDEKMRDELIFGLRKLEGVSLKTFKETYHKDLFELFPSLKEKIDLGLVEIVDDMLKLTYQGLFLGNQVFMVFI
ncbi:MAG: radical SAM family heme chaperone HemW [Acholeplasmataceae bacterium]